MTYSLSYLLIFCSNNYIIVSMVDEITYDFDIYANTAKAVSSQRFFKTKKGEYGFGDKFIGLTVPQVRLIAKKYTNMVSLSDIEKLLHSSVHEHRLCALIILVNLSKHANIQKLTRLKNCYTKNKRFVNNWDLVDVSAHHILGNWCYLTQNEVFLKKLAHSRNLWDKRIAMVSTYYFIKNNSLQTAFTIAKVLLFDSHDLIHKAVGWMLREAGKKDQKQLEQFLQYYASTMPRTALRYAIEKFSPKKRRRYMNI